MKEKRNLDGRKPLKAELKLTCIVILEAINDEKKMQNIGERYSYDTNTGSFGEE